MSHASSADAAFGGDLVDAGEVVGGQLDVGSGDVLGDTLRVT
jgi:hypothetical protein